MNVDSVYQSKEARPPLPFFEDHSYIFAAGGLTNVRDTSTSMYFQMTFHLLSMLVNP